MEDGPGLTELDKRVLQHITAYPGLGTYEIARALGLQMDCGKFSQARVETALLHLFYADAARFRRIRWDCRGGYKRIWYATGN